jgi:hypothetical protein
MSSDARRLRAADQVIRSGIAGGVAGCVVCTLYYVAHLTGPSDVQHIFTISGKDGRCAA